MQACRLKKHILSCKENGNSRIKDLHGIYSFQRTRDKIRIEGVNILVDSVTPEEISLRV